MPLEIKEITVTAKVVDTVSDTNNSAGTSSAAIVDVNALVAECVDQVLEILKEKNEL